jgi:hypothetical protein
MPQYRFKCYPDNITILGRWTLTGLQKKWPSNLPGVAIVPRPVQAFPIEVIVLMAVERAGPGNKDEASKNALIVKNYLFAGYPKAARRNGMLYH